ncbi:MAG: MBL fold metallo-hydrolase [Sulfurovaceae bacterium]|nr:MBL fold metallo-hydrolase [Sulfurovaceae bacterium]
MSNEKYTSLAVGWHKILKWQILKLFKKQQKDNKQLTIFHNQDMQNNSYMWLGHASLLCKLNNINIIIDPVLTNIWFYKRYTKLPIEIEKIKTDIILITHAHYDHFDKKSIKKLLKNNPKTIIVAPKGTWSYIKDIVEKNQFVELEWWENIKIMNIIINFVPSHHWSNRGLFDRNKASWGGYVIESESHTFFHSGDSAYGQHFCEIGKKFDIQEAFLPIGAYEPRNIMCHYHINPVEALQATEDLKAKILVPVHYGTFKLSDESPIEPLVWLENLFFKNKYSFFCHVSEIGRVYFFNKTSINKST